MKQQMFRLQVARLDDATQRSIRIVADSPAHAEQIAADQGWLVTGKPEVWTGSALHGLRWEVVVGALLLLLPLAVSIGRFVFDADRADREWESAMRSALLQHERFSSSNAYGATANSLERLEDEVQALRRSADRLIQWTIPTYFVAGVGVVLILRGIPRPSK